MRVLAGIVTYNRSKLLMRCIDALKEQVQPADGIIVINNGSTDDTSRILDEKNINYITQENVGSAGGWKKCINYALEQDYDAIWLMDDDGFPDKNALARLKPFLKKNIVCASSIVLREDDINKFVFPFPRLNKNNLPVLYSLRGKIPTLNKLKKLSSQSFYPFAHFFNGALIDIKAINKIGNVNDKFFMFGDEVDFFFRLRSIGDVVSVFSAKHYHPNVTQRPYTHQKIYFYLKNTIILNKKYMNYIWIRHLGAAITILYRTARRNGLAFAFSLVFGRHSYIFFKAFKRGLDGKIANDFDE